MEILARPVTITPAAAARIRRLLDRDGRPDAVLRMGVKGGGCSGFEYLLAIDPPRATDVTWTVHDVPVALDPRAERFLNGATLDADRNLLGGGLKWDNPNVAKACGCGTSFTPRRES